MNVHVTRVSIPAWSSVGYGEGWIELPDGTTRMVTFVGDHRPMRNLGDALHDATEPLIADVPDWALQVGMEVQPA